MYLSALKRVGDASDGAPEIMELSDGRQGTYETLRYMASKVREYKKDPQIRDRAIQLTSDLENKDFAGEVARIFEYVRDNIRYIQDVSEIETIQMPDLILEQRAGDCDDKSLLLAVMLESINHKTRFVAVGFDRDPQQFSHVLVETRIGSRWVPLETTEAVPMGWYPPGVTDELIVYN